MSLTQKQLKNRKRKDSEGSNPELGIGQIKSSSILSISDFESKLKNEPKEKRGLAERLSVEDKQKKRVSTNDKSKLKEDDSSFDIASVGRWQDLIAKETSITKKEIQESLPGGVPDYFKGIDIDTEFDSKESQNKRNKSVDQNRAAGENLPSFIFQGSKFRNALSGVEAENYNTLFGNSESKETPFKGVNLTSMSMKDVFKLVEKDGKFHKFNLKSFDKDTTAVGKYQMIGNTLRDLKERGVLKKLGIKDDTKFNENTQDLIAVHLAERRVKPKFSESDARKEMRDEWEGFKKLSDKELDAVIKEIRAEKSTFKGNL